MMSDVLIVNGKPWTSDHDRLDRRALAKHELIAQKIMKNPALVDRAKNTLARWKATQGGFWIQGWEKELDQPVEAIARFLREQSDYATELRQTSPFVGTLSPEEIQAINAAHRS